MNSLAHWMRARFTLLLLLGGLLAGCAGLGLQSEIDALMKAGQQLYAEQKYEQATDKFLTVIGKDQSYWPAYLWAARSFLARGAWGEAIANGRKAFELAPKDADTLKVFAQALFGGGADALKNGQFSSSVAFFKEYLQLEPGNAQAWLEVARAYLGQSDFRAALEALVQGLSSGGDRQQFIRELLNGGQQALSSGRYRESIDLLREFLKYDKKDIQAYLGLARAYWEAGDKGQALEAVQSVLKLDPRQVESLRFMLGR